MNIAGLNRLAAAPVPAKGQGAASSKDAQSFDDVFGQVQTPARPQPVAPKSNPPQRTPQASAQSTPSPAPQETESSNLPTQPNTPILDNPAFTERLMPAPNEVALVNPMAKPAVAAVKGEETVDALTRRAVWSTFLKKMKEELGVSAEDVLGAFDSLSAEDLAKPPQQTVDKVVMALGLDPQQSQVAKQYFMDLIDRTQARSLGEELAHSEKQISLTLMSQREVDRKVQNKAIDNLNQNFFMKGPYERPMTPVAPQTDNTAAANAAPTFAPAPALPADIQRTAPATPASGFQVPKELQTPTAKAATPPKVDVDSLIKKFTEGQGQSQSQIQSPIQPPAPIAAEAKTELTPATFAAPAAVAPPMAPIAAESSAAAGAKAAAANTGAEAMAALKAIFGGAQGSDSESELTEDPQFTRDASYLASGLAGEAQGALQGQPSEFQKQLNTVAPSQPMAVPDLVQNAQVMVRDGGGEMKVTLTPEGLGEVAMKVSVKDGKVNVQMITESDEAKRMIERSLGDLKSQLAQNQLQVMDIKIDTATNLGKQLEQQYQDAQRQMAQQTLEQFRQDHQGWRRSYFEVPGAKVYKNQAEAPRDVQAPTSVSARSRGGSRRLDLVA